MMDISAEVARMVAHLARRLLAVEESAAVGEERPPPDLPDGVFLQASRPYSNARHVRELLKRLSGEIYWLDRHLDLPALDIVADAASPGRHRGFVLIREGRPEDRLIRAASTLRQELAGREIDFDLLYVSPRDGRFHDRWLLATEGAWTLPPASALGRAGELKVSADAARVAELISELSTAAQSIFGDAI
jgi:hypothetical protein